MIVLVAIAALMISGSIAQNDDFLNPANVCKLMVDGTKIRDLNSCEFYYICRGGQANHYSCQIGKQYNKDKQDCVAPEQSTCGGNPDDFDTMCVGQPAKTWLADPSSCDGFYYCATATSKPEKGWCPDDQNFDGSKQACIRREDSKCDKGLSADPDSSSKNAICSVVPSKVYFGVSSDCNSWAVCKNGLYDSKKCGDNTKFNTDNGDCDYISKCSQSSGAVIPGAGDNEPDQFGGDCEQGEVGNYKSDGTCSGFYYCNAQLQWIRGVCESYRAYDATQNKCLARSNVFCANPCQNTKGSSMTWVNDPENCNGYFVCTNNQVTYKDSCGKTYFNVATQRCQNTLPDGYKACPWVPPPKKGSK